MITLTKERAEKLMRGLRVTTLFPADWQIATDDIAIMEKALNQAGATDETDETEISAFISKVFRYDSKTHRIMSEGYALGNNIAYFSDEQDAVSWLNEHRIPCTTFREGLNFMLDHQRLGWRHTGKQQWLNPKQDYFLVSKTPVMKAVYDAQLATGHWEEVVLQKDGLQLSLTNKQNGTSCEIVRESHDSKYCHIEVHSCCYDYEKLTSLDTNIINDTVYDALKDIYLEAMSDEAKETVDLENLVLAPLNLTREQLQEYADTVKIRNTEHIPDDWAITDEEADEIQWVLTSLGVNAYTSEEDICLIIGECFRLDTKTHRIMTAGYVADDDLAWFIEEEDAVEWLNANGVPCKTFEEAKTNIPEDSNIRGLYEAGWIEGYQFTFNEG